MGGHSFTRCYGVYKTKHSLAKHFTIVPDDEKICQGERVLRRTATSLLWYRDSEVKRIVTRNRLRGPDI